MAGQLLIAGAGLAATALFGGGNIYGLTKYVYHLTLPTNRTKSS